MSSIRTEWVAIDTNEYIYAVRRAPDEPASVELVFEKLYDLRLFVPFQVFIELQHNLTKAEQTEFLAIIRTAQDHDLSYTTAPITLIDAYKRKGAKKGDAAICAELDLAGVRWLISENRHFLSEIEGLPFRVLSAAEALETFTERAVTRGQGE